MKGRIRKGDKPTVLNMLKIFVACRCTKVGGANVSSAQLSCRNMVPCCG